MANRSEQAVRIYVRNYPFLAKKHLFLQKSTDKFVYMRYFVYFCNAFAVLYLLPGTQNDDRQPYETRKRQGIYQMSSGAD